MLAAVFTVVNFASSAYDLRTVSNANPNSTVAKDWFGKWPSLLASGIKPQCEPATIPINSKFYTNNTALQYTLLGVRDENEDSLPSLVYNNNQLQHCQVRSIQLLLDLLGGRTATQFGLSYWGIDAQARVVCKVPSDGSAGGLVTVDLMADYNLVPPTVSVYEGTLKFPGRNARHAASLYWGESLLSMYYLQVLIAMHDATSAAIDSDGIAPLKGVAYFTHSGNTSDISRLDYFDISWRGVQPGWYNYTYVSTFSPGGATISDLDKAAFQPNIWIPADRMAKSFESVILTDLGQQHTQPNILTNAKILQHFTLSFRKVMDYARHTYVPLADVHSTTGVKVHIGPATKNYDALKHETGPLRVNPATLAANYLCSVPHRKPTGELLMSLTVADLVFLQAVWFVFTLIVMYMMRKKDSTVDYCEGCHHTDDRKELLRSTSKAGSSYELVDSSGLQGSDRP